MLVSAIQQDASAISVVPPLRLEPPSLTTPPSHPSGHHGHQAELLCHAAASQQLSLSQ